MDIPLPKIIADVGPGGPLVTSMGGANALNDAMLKRKIDEVKANYAPASTEADINSKNAYARLVGLQPVGKLLANDAAWANLPDENKNAAIDRFYKAGMGQAVGVNALNQQPSMSSGVGQPSTNSLSGWISSKLKNAFGQNSSGGENALGRAQSSPAQYNAPAEGALTPEMSPQPDQEISSRTGFTPTPTPADQELMNWKKNRDALEALRGQEPLKSARPTYAENAGTYKGTLEEGKELGKIRAQSISDLDEQYQQAIQAEVPVQHLIDITQNPVFQNMRNKVPFFQDKQLQALSKIGTPEEQKMIGDFTTTATNAVSNTINSFRGRILDKEISMANQMKISPKDTWNVMIGKLNSIKTFNEMTKQRSRMASQLMQQQHLNRGEALEVADKAIDANAIRKSVESELNPKPTTEDILYMAKKYNISEDEVKNRLRSRGLL